MPESLEALRDESEEERLRVWRAKRLEIAEVEKRQRIAKRDNERAKAEKQKADQRRALALQLSPSASEIASVTNKIQRRSRSAALAFWLQFFAIFACPIAALAFYLVFIATPLFETQTIFEINGRSTYSTATVNAVIGGNQSQPNLQKSFAAHTFIQSQALMEDLDAETGALARFESEQIDPIQRIRPLSFLGIAKRQQFNRFVESRVDIQTGFVTLYVRSAQPESARQIADTTMAILSARLSRSEDDFAAQQKLVATRAVDDAQADLTTAQEELLTLQIKSGILDPNLRLTDTYARIRGLEDQVLELNREIQRARIAGRGERIQTLQSIELQRELEIQIADLRHSLLAGNQPLSTVLLAHEKANLEMQIASTHLEEALLSLARIEENIAKNRVDLSIISPTRVAQDAVRPNIIGTLVFGAILLGSFFCFARITFLRKNGALF